MDGLRTHTSQRLTRQTLDLDVRLLASAGWMEGVQAQMPSAPARHLWALHKADKREGGSRT